MVEWENNSYSYEKNEEKANEEIEEICKKILGLRENYSDNLDENYEDLKAKKEKNERRKKFRTELREFCYNAIMPLAGIGVIEGANFFLSKKEKKIRKVCDSLEAKIKNGIISEQLPQNYYLEMQGDINIIKGINLSNENTKYLNEIEQILYKAHQSKDVKYQRSILVNSFPNIYKIREVESGFLISTSVLLGLSLFCYGFLRFGRQIKRLYKERDIIKKRSNDFKDELEDFDN